VTLADHTRDDTMAAIARRILETAPPRFALAGLSMGGYIAFEILRQAPDRVTRLALLDTSARPDTPAQTERGDHDALTPPELAHEMAAGIEGARLVTVPGSGHLTPLERPEQVTDALVRWLEA
jgi:pimeloyl-ACP methyl ester carboxylesterase